MILFPVIPYTSCTCTHMAEPLLIFALSRKLPPCLIRLFIRMWHTRYISLLYQCEPYSLRIEQSPFRIFAQEEQVESQFIFIGDQDQSRESAPPYPPALSAPHQLSTPKSVRSLSFCHFYLVQQSPKQHPEPQITTHSTFWSL